MKLKQGMAGYILFLQGKIDFGEVKGFSGYAVTFDTSTLLYYLQKAANNKSHRSKLGPVVFEVLREPLPERREKEPLATHSDNVAPPGAQKPPKETQS